jgi:hypothetical protein
MTLMIMLPLIAAAAVVAAAPILADSGQGD